MLPLLYSTVLLFLVLGSWKGASGFRQTVRVPLPLRSRLYQSGGVEEESLPTRQGSSSGKAGSVFNAARLMYKFSRPHTIKGTVLASTVGVTRALVENPSAVSLKLVPRALIGLLALLAGNAYIVGINQIYDVKIDEINKPFLPIAAKALNEKQAWRIVIGCLCLGVGVVYTQFSKSIFSLYMIGVLLGTIYSVPPFQFKRFPLFAGSIIACVRGFLLNFGVYYAVREALNVPFRWNPVVVFISSFMTVFASVIAITKDLPDIEGDVKYKIETFAAKFGVKAIATGASAVLSAAYLAAMALPLAWPHLPFKRLPMVGGHALALAYFLLSFSRLQPSKLSSIKAFYKAIWNLFYFEYLIYLFV